MRSMDTYSSSACSGKAFCDLLSKTRRVHYGFVFRPYNWPGGTDMPFNYTSMPTDDLDCVLIASKFGGYNQQPLIIFGPVSA